MKFLKVWKSILEIVRFQICKPWVEDFSEYVVLFTLNKRNPQLSNKQKKLAFSSCKTYDNS